MPFAFDAQLTPSQFDNQALLIHGLKQTRSKSAVDLDRGTYDSIRQLVEWGFGSNHMP